MRGTFHKVGYSVIAVWLAANVPLFGEVYSYPNPLRDTRLIEGMEDLPTSEAASASWLPTAQSFEPMTFVQEDGRWPGAFIALLEENLRRTTLDDRLALFFPGRDRLAPIRKISLEEPETQSLAPLPERNKDRF